MLNVKKAKDLAKKGDQVANLFLGLSDLSEKWLVSNTDRRNAQAKYFSKAPLFYAWTIPDKLDASLQLANFQKPLTGLQKENKNTSRDDNSKSNVSDTPSITGLIPQPVVVVQPSSAPPQPTPLEELQDHLDKQKPANLPVNPNNPPPVVPEKSPAIVSERAGDAGVPLPSAPPQPTPQIELQSDLDKPKPVNPNDPPPVIGPVKVEEAGVQPPLVNQEMAIPVPVVEKVAQPAPENLVDEPPSIPGGVNNAAISKTKDSAVVPPVNPSPSVLPVPIDEQSVAVPAESPKAAATPSATVLAQTPVPSPNPLEDQEGYVRQSAPALAKTGPASSAQAVLPTVNLPQHALGLFSAPELRDQPLMPQDQLNVFKSFLDLTLRPWQGNEEGRRKLVRAISAELTEMTFQPDLQNQAAEVLSDYFREAKTVFSFSKLR